MPTVPTLATAPTAIRPIQTPFQDTRGATPEAFGAGQGLALAQAGRDMTSLAGVGLDLATKEQIDLNETEVKGLDVEYQARSREILRGDGTAENPGFYGTRGQNAVDAFPEVQKRLTDLRRELVDKGSNGRIKQVFGAVSAKNEAEELDTASKHRQTQVIKAADDASTARMGQTLIGSRDHYENTELVARDRDIVMSEVASQAQRNGWSPEQAVNETSTALTALYSGIVDEAMARGDPIRAQATYLLYKGDIKGKIGADLEDKLKSATLLTRAQREADRIIKLGLPAEDAYAEAQKIDVAEVRKAAWTELQGYFTVIQGAKTQARADEAEALPGRSRAEFDRIMGGDNPPKNAEEGVAAAASIKNPKIYDATVKRIGDHFAVGRSAKDDTRQKRLDDLREAGEARRAQNDEVTQEAEDFVGDMFKNAPADMSEKEARQKINERSADVKWRDKATPRMKELLNMNKAERDAVLAEEQLGRTRRNQQRSDDKAEAEVKGQEAVDTITRTHRDISERELKGMLDATLSKQADRDEAYKRADIWLRMGEKERAVAATEADQRSKAKSEKIRDEQLGRDKSERDVKEEARKVFDEISLHSDTMAAAQRLVEGITRGPLQDQTRKLMEIHYLGQARAAEEQLKSDRGEGWAAANAGDLSKLRPITRAALAKDGDTMAALENRVKQVARGEPVKTDWAYYWEVNNLSPEQLRKIDIGKAQAMLVPEDFTRLKTRYDAAVHGTLDASSPDSADNMLSARLPEIGLGPSAEKSKARDEVKGRLHRMFHTEIDRQEEGGKKLTNAQKRTILMEITDQQALRQPGMLYGENTTKFYDVKVPDDYKARVVKNYQKVYSRDPSEVEITRQYLLDQKAK